MSKITKALTVCAAAAIFVIGSQAAQAHGHHHHHHAGFFFGTPFYSSYAYDTGGCYWTHVRVWTGTTWRLRRLQVCG